MVAIVSGNSLGLSNTSAAVLGQNGLIGQSANGATNQKAVVNVSNGNLVLQSNDDTLDGRGLSIESLLTYNSDGLSNEGNGYAWSMGMIKQIGSLTGTINTVGSTIMRTEGDGSQVVYTYNAAGNDYVGHEGAGANDTISFIAKTSGWTWTDGASGDTETYGKNGLIIGAADPSGNKLTYTYNTAGLLAKITDANGDSTTYSYNSANMLSQISDIASGQMTSRITYQYDGLNRLINATVDLSPSDNSTADGNVYWTNYTYVDSTNRIASVTQTDGSQLNIIYNSQNQVQSVTDALGNTTGFSYGTNQTTVTDALGNVSTYSYDGAGRLTGAVLPAVSGVAQSMSYTYDTNGDLLTTQDTLGNTTNYSYDTNGNLLQTVDPDGDTVGYTYNGNNQVTSRTTYLVPATNGNPPSGAQTTYFVYGSANLVAFEITPQGRVTQNTYTTTGELTASVTYSGNLYPVASLSPSNQPTLTQLTAWVTGSNIDLTQTDPTHYSYNVRGQLASVTNFATVSSTGAASGGKTTKFAYDPTGVLMQTIDGDNNQTSYAYDGLNRLLGTQDAAGNSTITAYDDSNNSVSITSANGLITTSAYNANGEVLSVTQSSPDGTVLSTASYAYDADGNLLMSINPSDQHTWYLYDAGGRRVASIDPTGKLTQTAYNANGQPSALIEYTNTVDTAALVDANGKPTNPPLATVVAAAGPVYATSVNAYDHAGRLIYTVDAAGYVTRTNYDGAGNLVKSTAFATALLPAQLQSLGTSPSAADVAQVLPPSDPKDRTTRTFYDSDNNVIASLNADGYLTQLTRNGTGQVTQTVAYATLVSAGLQASGDLATILAAMPANGNGDDIVQSNYYNSAGQLAYSLDGDGYLTAYTYDNAGNLKAQTRYATQVQTAAGAPAVSDAQIGLSYASLVWSTNSEDHVTRYTYTALNQLATETDPVGIVTQYVYDNMGNMISTTVSTGAADANARTINMRYDLQGRLVAELSGNAAAQITSTSTAAQIATIWATQATTYTYDAAGHRTSMTDPDGNRTLYYYDQDGRLAYTVDALGEVQGQTYNSIGQIAQRTTYAQSIATAALTAMSGGVLNSDELSTTAFNILVSLSDTGRDRAQSYTYDVRGELASVTDSLGYTTSEQYDAFGDVKQTLTQTDSAGDMKEQDTAYDNLGQATATQFTDNRSRTGGSDIITAGSSAVLSTSVQYDAFGRVTQTTDGNGNIRKYKFDQLGRQIAVSDPASGSTPGVYETTVYDAFDRATQQVDFLGNTTSIVYNSAKRSMTVTSAQGIKHTVVDNEFGQQATVTDSNGNTTTYNYDFDGNLVSVVDKLGTEISNKYDAADNLSSSTDARGVVTSYAYDAANRVISRTVDQVSASNPQGLNLVTQYSYNTSGQVTQVIDPNGNVTQTAYDQKGEVSSITVDPNGLDLVTRYQYDARGHVLQVTDPNGNITLYQYDAFGRRVAQKVDPNGLDITTSYYYDDNSNLISTIDPNGNVARAVYDADNRAVYTVDAAGGVTFNAYDTDGNVTQSTHYAKAIDVSALPSDPATALNLQAVTLLLSPDATQDATTYRVYDKDSRLSFTVDGKGDVTKLSYDSNGNLTQATSYATPIAAGTPRTITDLGAAVAAIANPALDRSTINVYDARNRLIATASAQSSTTSSTGTVQTLWAIVTYTLDGNGNVVGRTAYATLRSSTGLVANPSEAQLAAWIKGTPANAALDQSMQMVYDAANRLTYSATAQNTVNGAVQWSVEQRSYDSDGNVLQITDYATFLSQATEGSQSPAQWIAGVASNTTADRTMRMAYDAASRCIFTIDSLGDVKQNVYDSNGNVICQVGYATPVSVNGLLNTSSQIQALKDALTPPTGDWTNTADWSYWVNDGKNHISATYYDAANRAVYQIDGQGYLKQNAYDANGNVVQTVAYASTPFFFDSQFATGGATLVQVQQSIRTSNNDRTTSYAFDADNRLVYAVSANGFVTRNIYDALGRVAQTIRYGQGGSPLLDLLQSIPTAQVITAELEQNGYDDPTDYQSTSFQYDAQGNLTSSTDALGNTERYGYDALGRKTNYTNPNGATWNYTYDAAGQVVRETDPAVTTTSAAQGTFTGATDSYAATTADVSAQLQTLTSYDAFGNVTASTQEQVATGTGVASQVRTTKYVYDLKGHQTETILPTVSVYNPSADNVAQNGADQSINGGPTRTDISVAPTTVVIYDALGNAVANQDAAGNFSYKTYNSLGQVSYAIDADGYVTGYQYDAFGNATTTTRYANAVSLAGGANHTAGSTLLQVAALYQTLLNRTPDSTALGDCAGLLATGTTQAQIALSILTSPEGQHYFSTTESATAFVTTLYQFALNRAPDTAGLNNWVAKLTAGESQSQLAVDFITGILAANNNDTKYFTAKIAGAVAGVALAKAANGGIDRLVAALANPGVDRVIQTSYNNLGQVVTVTDPTSEIYADSGNAMAVGLQNRVSTTRYNAFGEVIEQTVTGQSADGEWWQNAIGSDTRYYYDKVGNQTAILVRANDAFTESVLSASGLGGTPSSGGYGGYGGYGGGATPEWYLTTKQYDAFNNVTQQTQYAKLTTLDSQPDLYYDLPNNDGHDQVSAYTYDNDNRKISETKNLLGWSSTSGGYPSTNLSTTYYGYDAVGNQISVVDPSGAATYTYYNAQGQANAVATVQLPVLAAQLYVFMFDRGPDAQELGSAVQQLSQGGTLAQLAQNLLAAPPSGSSFDSANLPNAGNTNGQAVVDAMNALEAQPAGTSAKVLLDQKVSDAINAVEVQQIGYDANTMSKVSAAADDAALPVRTQVTQLFQILFGRAPDRSGLIFWTSAILSGQTDLAGVAAAMVGGSEGQSKIATLPDTSDPNFQSDATSLVEQLYGNATGLTTAPGDSNVATWVADLTSGASVAHVALEIISAISQGTISGAGNFNTQTQSYLARAQNSYTQALPTFTQFKLDIYGNVVQQTVFANGDVDATASGHQAPLATAGSDRSGETIYNIDGLATETIDALGHATYTSYDVFGRIAKTWQSVTVANPLGSTGTVRETDFVVNQYDALGNLIDVVTPGQLSAAIANGTTPANASVALVQKQNTYDAFGDITGKSLNGVQYEFDDYDNAGNLWRTNAGDGVTKVYLHNVTGQETEEVEADNFDLKTLDSAQALVNLDNRPDYGLLVTQIYTNMIGQTIEQLAPAQNIDVNPQSELGENSGVGAASQDAQNQTDNTVLQMSVTATNNNPAGSSGSTGGGNISNSVTVNMSSVEGLGAGDLKVVLDYTAPANGTPTEIYTETQEFSAAQVISNGGNALPDRLTLNWSASTGVDTVSRVQVYKKDLAGQWVLLMDNGAQNSVGSYIEIAAPQDASAAVTVAYQPNGAGIDNLTPTITVNDSQLVNFGELMLFSTSTIPEGSYNYTVSYQDAGDTSAIVHDSGSMTLVSPATQIAQLFVAVLGRAPDQAGLDFYVDALNSGQSLAAIAQSLYDSSEARALYGANAADEANGVALAFLGTGLGMQVSSTDPSVLAFAQQLSAASSASLPNPAGEAIVTFINGLEDGSFNAFGIGSVQLFNNKAAAGRIYATSMNGDSVDTARAIMALVTASDITAALASAVSAQAAAGQGSASAGVAANDAASVSVLNLLQSEPDRVATVVELYQLILNRVPDAQDTVNAVAALDAGTTEATLAQSMLDSTEARLGNQAKGPTYPDAIASNPAQFIPQVFQMAFGRAPDDDGLSFWENASASGITNGQLLVNIVAAAVPADAATLQHTVTTKVATVTAAARSGLAQQVLQLIQSQPAVVNQVMQLYTVVFNRSPDMLGLANAVAALDNGTSAATLAQNMLTSDEAINGSAADGNLGNGDYPAAVADDPTQFVTQVFQLAFGRAPDDAGLTFWKNASASGQSNGQLLVNILAAAVPGDAATLQSRVSGFLQTTQVAASALIPSIPLKVVELYTLLTGQFPDKSDLRYWSTRMQADPSEADIAEQLFVSPAVQARLASLGNDVSQFIDLLCQSAQDSTGSIDPAIVQNWQTQYQNLVDAATANGIATGTTGLIPGLGDLLVGMADSFHSQSPYFSGRVNLALTYAGALGGDSEADAQTLADHARITTTWNGAEYVTGLNLAQTMETAEMAVAFEAASPLPRLVAEAYLLVENRAPTQVEIDAAIGGIGNSANNSDNAAFFKNLANSLFHQLPNQPQDAAGMQAMLTALVTAALNLPTGSGATVLSSPLQTALQNNALAVSCGAQDIGTSLANILDVLTGAGDVNTSSPNVLQAQQRAMFNNKVNLAQAWLNIDGSEGGAAAEQTLQSQVTASDSATAINGAIAGVTLTSVFAFEQQVTQVYVTMLHRAPSAGELTAGVALLQQNAGAEGGFAGIATLAQSLFDGPWGEALYQGDPVAMALAANDYANDGITDSQIQSVTSSAPTAQNVGVYAAYMIGQLQQDSGSAGLLFRNRVAAGLAYAALDGQSDSTAAAAVVAQVSAYNTGNALSAALSAVGAQTSLNMRATVQANASGNTSATPTEYLLEDRWGNLTATTDPRNVATVTRTSYNQDNEVLSTTYADGSEVINDYDTNGRLVATTDANGNVNQTVYDMNGNIGSVIHADGGVAVYTSDTFGERTSASQTLQAGGAVTTYSYNANGELTSAQSAPVQVYVMSGTATPTAGNAFVQIQSSAVQTVAVNYTYDELGRRTLETDGTAATSTGAATVATVTATHYDMAGNITATIQGSGASVIKTTTVYDAFNHKISQTDGNSNTQTWQVDAFGRLQSSTDMSGSVTTYGYDAAGHLIDQASNPAGTKYAIGDGVIATQDNLLANENLTNVTPPAQHIRYVYSGNKLVEIDDVTLGETTDYTYDLDGNVTSEVETAPSGNVIGQGQARQVVQDNHITYDNRNRVTTIEDSRYVVTYRYDANGNRIEQKTQYIADNSAQAVDDGNALNNASAGTISGGANDGATVIDDWNTFDAMNRESIVDGVQLQTANGVHIATNSTQGHQLTYDTDGNRISDTYAGTQYVAGANGAAGTTLTQDKGGVTTERYTYNGRDQLVDISRDGINIANLGYDAAGHEVYSNTDPIDGAPGPTAQTVFGSPMQDQASDYNTAGQLVYQTEYYEGTQASTSGSGTGDGSNDAGGVNTIGTGGDAADVVNHYDGAGNLTSTSTDVHAGNNGYIQETAYVYAATTGYKQIIIDTRQEQPDSTNHPVYTGGSQIDPNISETIYDANGNVVSVLAQYQHYTVTAPISDHSTGGATTAPIVTIGTTQSVVNNAEGEIVANTTTARSYASGTTVDANGATSALATVTTSVTHSLIVGGQFIGSSSNVSAAGVTGASFGNGFTTLSASVASGGSGIGTYVVQTQGETLQGMQAAWGAYKSGLDAAQKFSQDVDQEVLQNMQNAAQRTLQALLPDIVNNMPPIQFDAASPVENPVAPASDSNPSTPNWPTDSPFNFNPATVSGLGAVKGGSAATTALYTPIQSEGPYGSIRGVPEFQAHHLNQNAVYKSGIAPNQGASINIQGNAINEAGSTHFEAHASLENWWNQYRRVGGVEGPLFGQRPTNSEYGEALKKSLTDAGLNPEEAARLADVAKQQRIEAGFMEDAPVPRIPRRVVQTPTSFVNGDLWHARMLASDLQVLGRGAMVVGAVVDGASLYSQYRISQQTGNYGNTYNEATRIAGGWAGAWAAGQVGAEFGASFGLAVGGPIGAVAFGFVGGLIGGGFGYAAGSYALPGIANDIKGLTSGPVPYDNTLMTP